VYGNFLIHDDPDDPHRQVHASIGYVEICGGPNGFVKFNNYLIELSGPASTIRAEQLKEIGAAVTCLLNMRKRSPPLRRYP
jgi:hypothetical protein